jgi:heme exporter protein D
MFTMFLLGVLAIAYVVLKTLNMRAKFAEEDARREAEEQRLAQEAEEEAEDAMMRAEAIDVDPEVIEDSEEE